MTSVDNEVTNAIDATLEQRGSSYGEFKENAAVTQGLMHHLRQHSSVFSMHLLDTDTEAMHMTCHKIARIVCGNGLIPDNWHDIAGYAKLARNMHAKPAVLPGNNPVPGGLFNNLKLALAIPSEYGTILRELQPFEVKTIDAIFVALAYIATDRIFAYHCWETIEQVALAAQSELEDYLDE